MACHGASRLVQVFNHPAAPVAVDIGAEAAIDGILFDRSREILQAAAHVPAQIDD